MNSIKNVSSSLIIGFDFTHSSDKDILLVGQKPTNKPVKIINAFQGEEAREIYLKLTTPKNAPTKDAEN